MAEAEASPNPTKSGTFTTVFRGYDQVQVDEHLKKLSDRLDRTARSRDDATASVADLTKALGHAQQELVETKAALTRMAEEPTGPAAMSERVKTMMKLAEEEIDELRKKAEEEAAATRSAADAYSEKTREDARTEAARLADEAKAERTRSTRRPRRCAPTRRRRRRTRSPRTRRSRPRRSRRPRPMPRRPPRS
ncbi:DivIVA domain-containing protein [Saccharomonospora sp. CUA-673]|uniref:DivIVA domain-containing protein n=1 Tax=Saccharomonospora sp. CUA-673 TaxID=1904969 RepID=UPI00096A5799|nr:DivIVA domain-containing protein [Saccharomonospora sp. CUA-673]